MRARIISSVLALTLTGIFLTALALSGPETPVYSTPPDIEPPAVSAGTVLEIPEGFWVCEFEGYIAVYHNADRGTPIETTDVALRSLRGGDQEMLRGGVFFENYMDVVRFLEDFGP
ncbi:MAG: hypothetical protein LBH95_08950 [Oscillospiraceae bacterium]|jgi:hypothetical protein|nr:hypothetical protein [Oscillospiraceae bacterium]